MPTKKRVPVLPVCMLFFLLAGCTDGMENSPEKEEKAIRFSLPSLTRSINSVDDLKKAGTYAVWGHSRPEAGDGNATTWFNNETITYTKSTDKWEYKFNDQYWYSGNTYHFHALYPQPAESGLWTVGYSTDNKGTLSIDGFDATQPADGTAMTDLLYASATDISGTDMAALSNPAVSLNFRHLLARVKFLGYTNDRYLGTDDKPSDQVRKLKIKSFEVTGIASAGGWDGSKWTTTGQSTATYKANIDENNGLLLGNDPTNIFGENEERTLLLIPQTFTNLTVRITYEYTEGNLGTLSASSTLRGTWEAGKSYAYKFSINSEIFFDTPQVDDWKDMPITDNGSNIDVTK